MNERRTNKDVATLVFNELYRDGPYRVCNLARKIGLKPSTVSSFLRRHQLAGYTHTTITCCGTWRLTFAPATSRGPQAMNEASQGLTILCVSFALIFALLALAAE
jgi:hypothetical protein